MSYENLDESIPVLIFRLIISPIAIIGNSIILYIVLRFKEFRSLVHNCLMSLLAFGQLLVGKRLILKNSSLSRPLLSSPYPYTQKTIQMKTVFTTWGK